jgi:TonB family protein
MGSPGAKRLALALLASLAGSALAQQPAGHDAALELAAAQTGRALFLRCFCADDSLGFDPEGRPIKELIKTADWTLAGVNIQRVERKSPGQIELEGVRVAVRYAPDRNEFDRHPLNQERVRILLPAPAPDADPRAFQHTLDAVFALGIDLRLQQAMPAYWQHYFQPQLPWPADSLTGQQVLNPTHSNSQVVDAAMAHKADAGYTLAASADRVQGTVVLRGIVAADGGLHRTYISQPLGYGLDERAVEASQRARFNPATLAGKPIAEYIELHQQFVIAP